MFIFDGEHVTANIATGGEGGSALDTLAAALLNLSPQEREKLAALLYAKGASKP